MLSTETVYWVGSGFQYLQTGPGTKQAEKCCTIEPHILKVFPRFSTLEGGAVSQRRRTISAADLSALCAPSYTQTCECDYNLAK